MHEVNDGLDTISLVGLEARGHHGVLPQERRDGQVFRVDLHLAVDLQPAARSDRLQDTLDYGTLALRVRHAIENDPVDLIETLTERIAALCLDDPRVARARVTLHKPEAPIEATFTDVAVTMTRSRDD
jgi:dihydroneopterin aldolase